MASDDGGQEKERYQSGVSSSLGWRIRGGVDEERGEQWRRDRLDIEVEEIAVWGG